MRIARELARGVWYLARYRWALATARSWCRLLGHDPGWRRDFRGGPERFCRRCGAR